MFTVTRHTKTPLVGPIVMVDDEIDLVRSTVEMLRKEFDPTPVIGISDPREALALLDRERPAVLITDIRMPHINGLELIIYAQKKWSSIPIIAITARHEEAMEKACRDVGMVDFIPKDIWRPKWEPMIIKTLTRWLPAGITERRA